MQVHKSVYVSILENHTVNQLIRGQVHENQHKLKANALLTENQFCSIA